MIRIGAADTATGKITIYAHAITAIQQRMAPVFLALRDAAATDPDCASLWNEIAERRATNMLAFAADLRSTGELREDITDGQVADIIWSMNAAEYWDLLVRERAGPRPVPRLAHRRMDASPASRALRDSAQGSRLRPPAGRDAVAVLGRDGRLSSRSSSGREPAMLLGL